LDRLTLITACIPPCRRLIDIGSDHATVPLSLLRNGTCEGVLITDINEGPIEVARLRVEAAGFTYACRFLQTDGLDDVDPVEGDVLLISGLGGENIARIIERGIDKLSLFKRLILQPQTKENKLRETINRLPLSLLDEIVAVEDRRLYVVMICDFSKNAADDPISEIQIEFGPKIMERIGSLLRISSRKTENCADARTALKRLSADDAIVPIDRSRIAYVQSKYDKIARRARYHQRDRQLLESFDRWIFNHI